MVRDSVEKKKFRRSKRNSESLVPWNCTGDWKCPVPREGKRFYGTFVSRFARKIKYGVRVPCVAGRKVSSTDSIRGMRNRARFKYRHRTSSSIFPKMYRVESSGAGDSSFGSVESVSRYISRALNTWTINFRWFFLYSLLRDNGRVSDIRGGKLFARWSTGSRKPWLSADENRDTETSVVR